MKKKSLAATAISLCMVIGMSTPVYAANVDGNVNADGTEVTAPGKPSYDTNGGGNTQDAGMSYNEAVINGTDGTNFYTTNDDDSKAAADDTTGADINVWAKVTDSGSKIYKVDIAWGAMKFLFDSGSGKWNTTTHTYDNTGTTTAQWVVTDPENNYGYIDGTNNKVDITNHSNDAIDAALTYAMNDANGASTAFNDAPTGDNAVIGHFFDINTKAVTASETLTNTYASDTPAAVADAITSLSLPTADKYTPVDPDNGNAQGTEQTAGARCASTFFAFSGTPDTGRGASLDTFRKVGVITVTVTPSTYLPKNDTEASTFN